jgi:hypothetical protein
LLFFLAHRSASRRRLSPRPNLRPCKFPPILPPHCNWPRTAPRRVLPIQDRVEPLSEQLAAALKQRDDAKASGSSDDISGAAINLLNARSAYRQALQKTIEADPDVIAARNSARQATTRPDGESGAATSADDQKVEYILDERAPIVDLDGVPLFDALAFFGDLSRVKVRVNWEALEFSGISKNTSIRFKIAEVTLRQILEDILIRAGSDADFRIVRGEIVVSTKTDFEGAKPQEPPQSN